MSINIKTAPENYSSAFTPCLYSIGGTQDSAFIDIETIESDSNTVLGVKRFAGAEEVVINTSNYLRRRLNPQPVTPASCRFVLPEGRSIRAHIRVGAIESGQKIFTAAMTKTTPYQLLSSRSAERTIRSGEDDELAFLAEEGELIAEVAMQGTTVETFTADQLTINTPRMVVFTFDTASLLAHSQEPDSVESFEISILANGTKRMVVKYRIGKAATNSVRLCWLNTSGAFDYHTFTVLHSRESRISKGRMISQSGHRTLHSAAEEHLTILCKPMAEKEMEALAELAGSPKVFICRNKSYLLADITTDKITLSSQQLTTPKVELRIAKPKNHQQF